MDFGRKFSGELAWSSGHESKVNLDIILFKESGSSIVYCPALDLSGYGKNQEEAVSSFKTVLGQYFDYTLKKGTLHKDLSKLGWQIKKGKNKPMIAPELSKLLTDNEEFARIFNTKDFRKITKEIQLPVLVWSEKCRPTRF